MISTRFLPMVVHVALDRGQDHPALGAGSVPRQVRFDPLDRRLHGLGALQHERQLHLPGAEPLAHLAHGPQQDLVDDLQGRDAAQGLVHVVEDAPLLAAQDVPPEPLGHRQEGGFRFRFGRSALGAEHRQHHLEGIVALGPAVEDQVLHRPALVSGDGGHRQHLGGVEDGQVQPGPDRVVEHQRVDHVPHLGRQPEADVADPQHGEHPGEAGLDLPDRLQGGPRPSRGRPRRRCPG